MKLSLGFSPCPNDTFIFDALVNNKIDTDGFEFNLVIEDVEKLNQLALQGKLDISKISFGVYHLLKNDYRILSSGAALGHGVGPILISKKELSKEEKTINQLKIVLPGEHTTAHLLFSMAYPHAKNKTFKIFSEIENTLLNEEADAGVIIHENRFTYQSKGLHKIIDLGEFWQNSTGYPVPLGGIVMKKKIENFTILSVESIIKKSLEFAINNYPNLPDFVKLHAQEMDEIIMRRHIDLYVNKYSLNLGKKGFKAIELLTGQL